MTDRSADVLPVNQSLGGVTEQLAGIPLHFPARRRWLATMVFACALLLLLMVSIAALFTRGVGIWGINIPVNWAFAIHNYVWWLGIGHAGTLISAFLLLTGSEWRNSLNRFAETMTLFAVICAGIYPVLHLGRPWYLYWMFPYPATMGVWPQFRSPLEWDIWAVLTYLTVSLAFWYTGLIPDLAAARDRSRKRGWQIFFGITSLGWRGSAAHWQRWSQAYRLTAGLAVPLVVSVHSEVSLLFAAGQVHGWHSTIFPPYFVAGAIYSGFAMVLMLAIPIRKIYKLEDFITERHLQNSAKVMLATGLIVAYGYGIEAFMGWYSGNRYDAFLLWNRLHGPYSFFYYMLLICNLGIPQVLWISKLRSSPVWLFLVSLVVLVGMWLERFIIVVVSLHRDFLTSSWGMYYPTRWDWMTYIGTIGMFLAAMFLFVRILPMISIFEMRTLLPEAEVKE